MTPGCPAAPALKPRGLLHASRAALTPGLNSSLRFYSVYRMLQMLF